MSSSNVELVGVCVDAISNPSFLRGLVSATRVTYVAFSKGPPCNGIPNATMLNSGVVQLLPISSTARNKLATNL